MSRSTSSLSTLTTVPVTMSPSSNSTMVPEMASAKDMPPRSSLTTCIGWYSPSASVPPNEGDAAGAGAASAGEVPAGEVGASSASVAAGPPGVVLSGPATSGAGVVLGPSCSNIGCLLLDGHG